MKSSQEKNELKGKVNALSSILKMGHEAFEISTIEETAAYIVNSTRAIIPYARSSLIDIKEDHIHIISISGQPEVNAHSEYSENLKTLLYPFKQLGKILFLNNEILEEYKAEAGAREAFKYLKGPQENEIILVPMYPPGKEKSTGESFIWVLELEKDKAIGVENFILLLSLHYREALWYHARTARSDYRLKFLKLKKKIFEKKIVLTLSLVLLLMLVFWRVSQSAIADFELTPSDENIQYASYEGIIKESLYQNGDKVEENDIVIKYDTEELLFQLSEAQKEYDEISAELDRVSQKSFTSNEELSKIKLLALKKEKKKIGIDRINWYLSKSEVKAGRTGIIDIAEKSRLEGKAVRAGEKLFEVLSPENLIAQITLNEKDASVLGNSVSVTLYLHAKPESPIKCKIISISPKPVLCKNGQFCYIIKADLKNNSQGTICGMRGIARVRGKKISLGYYLFRNLILWWRKI